MIETINDPVNIFYIGLLTGLLLLISIVIFAYYEKLKLFIIELIIINIIGFMLFNTELFILFVLSYAIGFFSIYFCIALIAIIMYDKF